MSAADPVLLPTRAERIRLLAELMNTLAEEGVISASSLRQVAIDVMAIDYQEDEDLLHFTGLHEDLHDE